MVLIVLGVMAIHSMILLVHCSQTLCKRYIAIFYCIDVPMMCSIIFGDSYKERYYHLIE